MSEHITAGGVDENDVDHIYFGENRLLADLSGEFDAHLAILEDVLGVRIDPLGNRFAVSGEAGARGLAIAALKSLYEKLCRDEGVGEGDVRAAIKLTERPTVSKKASGSKATSLAAPSIKTPKRMITARTPNQAVYMNKLRGHDLTFGVGPAGTGKTYLAVAHAVGLLLSGAVERIILSRPALEAGERIGFLPGDMKEKIDPYLRPLYDALHDIMHTDYVERRIAAGDIEIAPIAFMRGRTLARSAVILDEAQNATPVQMKMFLTRLGEGAHMAVTGDLTQSDLPPGQASGLADALSVLSGVDGVAQCWFEASDVVRHPLVTRIVDAYDRQSTSKKR